MTQNSTPEVFLSGKKLKALEALLASGNIDDACKSCGLSRSSMYRFLRDPVFTKELQRAKRQLIDQAILRLQQACTDAAQTLVEVCKDRDATAASRVSASKEILSNALKAVELEDIEVRLKALEERVASK